MKYSPAQRMKISWSPGVSTVQIQNAAKKAPSVSTDAHSEQSQLLGLVAVIVSCISSGFAGVYFERILKGMAMAYYGMTVSNVFGEFHDQGDNVRK
jgi:UDP-sugar transporter A1/2/3